MKMYPLCLIIVLISNVAIAQNLSLPHTMTPGINQPGTTLHQVVDQLGTGIFASDSSEGGYVTQLNNFKKFWQDRAFSNDSAANDSTQTNMFSQYFTALRRGVAARGFTGCGTGGFHGNWKVLGPDALSNQAVGYVSQVWSDTANSNVVLAATIGGLFKTNDGGKNWFCITDNAPVVTGITGVSCMAVNPLNSNMQSVMGQFIPDIT